MVFLALVCVYKLKWPYMFWNQHQTSFLSVDPSKLSTAQIYGIFKTWLELNWKSHMRNFWPINWIYKSPKHWGSISTFSQRPFPFTNYTLLWTQNNLLAGFEELVCSLPMICTAFNQPYAREMLFSMSVPLQCRLRYFRKSSLLVQAWVGWSPWIPSITFWEVPSNSTLVFY